MKHTFRLFGLLMMAFVMTLGLGGCSNEDEPAVDSSHDPALIGLWANKYDKDFTFLFEKNGKFTSEDDGEWDKGTWSTSDGIVTITLTSSSYGDDDTVEVRWKYEVTPDGELNLYDTTGSPIITLIACNGDERPSDNPGDNDDPGDEVADEATHDPALVGVWTNRYDWAESLSLEKNGTFKQSRGMDWIKGTWSTSDGYFTLKATSASFELAMREQTARYEVSSEGIFYLYDASGDCINTYIRSK